MKPASFVIIAFNKDFFYRTLVIYSRCNSASNLDYAIMPQKSEVLFMNRKYNEEEKNKSLLSATYLANQLRRSFQISICQGAHCIHGSENIRIINMPINQKLLI